MNTSKAHTILTIDDEPEIRTIFRKYLSNFDYDILEAEDGHGGLEIVENEKPDLILVDLDMPGISGLDFLARIKSDYPDKIVIVISGTGEINDIIEALKLGAWDYLVKPIDNLSLLRHSVKKGLDRFETIQKNNEYKTNLETEVAKRTEDLSSALTELKKLSMAVEQSPSMVVITDTDAIIEYVNPKFSEISGYQPREVIGQNPSILSSGNTPDETYKEMWKTLLKGKTWRGELCNRKKNGQIIWEYAYITPIFSSNGILTNYVGVKEDITTRKEYEKKLLHQANYDSLTNLPNRFLFIDRLSQAIQNISFQKHIAVLLIDIDHFQKVNETLGHDAGDQALEYAAKRLQGCLEKNHTAARFSGDQFVVLVPDLNSPENSNIYLEDILKAFSAPFHIRDHEFILTVSIGITIYPKDGSDPQILLRNADSALHKAKQTGRNRYHFFSKEINDKARKKVILEYHLRHALEKNEISVCFQPIIDALTGMVSSAEALVRWSNPVLGMVSPDKFIPVAEESGLIVDIGEFVLQKAITEALRWQELYTLPLKVAVNVSSVQFSKTPFHTIVGNLIKEHKLSPDLLEVEITESLLVVDVEETVYILEQLRSLGVSVAVDDFGTGYSSLSYLKRFPAQKLKIDMEFIKSLPGDDENAKLVRAIVAMGHSLNMKVLAEGVETIEQLEYLKSIGCDYIQGYLFSKPLTADDFRKFLSEN